MVRAARLEHAPPLPTTHHTLPPLAAPTCCYAPSPRRRVHGQRIFTCEVHHGAARLLATVQLFADYPAGPSPDPNLLYLLLLLLLLLLRLLLLP